ncbi:MAG: protease inhibitor I42 family protein [Acidimicrobiia bacterium]
MTRGVEAGPRMHWNTSKRIARVAATGIIVVGLAGFGLAGCDSDSSKSSSSSTSTSTKDDATQVFTQAGGDLSVENGETFVISLESNPSTGFVWTVAQEPDAAIVTFEDQSYEKADSTALGAPGTERFTFRAVGTGTTLIGLQYARPSGPDSPDNTNDTYTVTVG